MCYFLYFYLSFFFFFNDTATTEIYTLSLHDALPISRLFKNKATTSLWYSLPALDPRELKRRSATVKFGNCARRDRKSTRLNSSHMSISYAVFCLKKKKKKKQKNKQYTNTNLTPTKYK